MSSVPTHLHGVVRDLVQPLDVLVVRRVPQGGVAEEQPAQDVGVAAGEHLRELRRTIRRNETTRTKASDTHEKQRSTKR